MNTTSHKIKLERKYFASYHLKFWARGGGGLLERGANLKFIRRQRQNYTMSMEFELRSVNNYSNYELWHYLTNTIKN